MANVTVLLVDDNVELRTSMRSYMEHQDDVTVIGECSNGVEAVAMLDKLVPDVVVLDIIMPQMDGYGFMEELNRRQLEHPPQVIVVSALGRDDFIMRAVELGARYYMIKPVEMSVLLSRIHEVSGQSMTAPEHYRFTMTTHAPSIDEKLSNLFLTIGIPAHIKGYAFLREAVKMVVDNPDIINRITKELYPGIAKHFNTSASKVERAIRHAIEVAWNRGRIDTLNKAFGCKVACPEDKPTNGEFIAMLSEHMKMDETKAS